jgi:hypothetical protein
VVSWGAVAEVDRERRRSTVMPDGETFGPRGGSCPASSRSRFGSASDSSPASSTSAARPPHASQPASAGLPATRATAPSAIAVSEGQQSGCKRALADSLLTAGRHMHSTSATAGSASAMGSMPLGYTPTNLPGRPSAAEVRRHGCTWPVDRLPVARNRRGANVELRPHAKLRVRYLYCANRDRSAAGRRFRRLCAACDLALAEVLAQTSETPGRVKTSI